MSEIIKFNTEEAAKGLGYAKEVPTFNLVDENDPILRQVLPDFNFDNPPVNPNEFASTLVETCKKKNGFGLSANQCGFEHRVFVMGGEDEFVAFFNPKILSHSDDEVLMTEGCLSFPMLGLKISRPSEVYVEYYDFTGNKKEAKFTGLSARIFQHELDHLNGLCYTERSKPMALKMGMKKRGKFNKLVQRYETAQKKIDSKLK